MNRSTIYQYLNSIKEFKRTRYKTGKGHSIKFYLDNDVRFTQIMINDNWWIENFFSLVLSVTRLIIQDVDMDMKVYVEYKDIKKIDIQIEEGYL